MRRLMNILPMILLMAGLPAHSVQSEAPNPSATHRIQVFRTGKGEPRVRDAVAARTASQPKPDLAQPKGTSRPYKAPKPGEGAPKG